MGKLGPDSGELTVQLLIHISSQLNNASVPGYTEQPFAVEQSDVIANALFFASLALLLVTSFLAMLVKGWIRDFDRDLPSNTAPELRAREHEYRLHGLIQYKLPEIVNTLPILIQIALALFCVGLLVILKPINPEITFTTLGILAIGLVFYIMTTSISASDSSAPFPSFVSRLLFPLVHRCVAFILPYFRWRWERASVAYPTSSSFDLPTFGRRVLSFFQHKLSKDEIGQRDQIANIEATLDSEICIMERLVRSTLIAPENLSTFLTIAEWVAADNRLRASSPGEWRFILSALGPSMSEITSLNAIRGFFRIITVVYETDAPQSASLLEYASKWMRYSESQSQLIDREFSERVIYAHSARPLKAVIPENQPDGSDLFIPLTSIHMIIGQIKMYLELIPGWDAACQETRDRHFWKTLSSELPWLTEFLQSPLFYDLEDDLKRRFTSRSTLFLEEIFIDFSMPDLVGDLSLFNLALNATMALSQVWCTSRDTTVMAKQSNDKPRRLLIQIKSGDGETAINFEFVLAILSSATTPGSSMSGVVLPLLLALQSMDPCSLLYSRVDAINLRQSIFDRFPALNTSELTHNAVLHSVINTIPRSEVLESFTIFLKYWDHLTTDLSTPPDASRLDFVRTTTTLLLSTTDEPDSVLWRNDLTTRLCGFQNKWLVLHFRNLFDQSHNLMDLFFIRNGLTLVSWRGVPFYESVVEQTLAAYESGSIEPEWDLLKVFDGTTSFRTYLRCLCLPGALSALYWGSDKNLRAEEMFRTVREEKTENKTTSYWYDITEVLYPRWVELPQDWRQLLASIIRDEDDRHLEWMTRVLEALQRRLRQQPDRNPTVNIRTPGTSPLNVAGGSSHVIDEQLLRATSIFLPFMADLLEISSRPLTPEEAQVLIGWDVASLDTAFGEDFHRQRIVKLFEPFEDS